MKKLVVILILVFTQVSWSQWEPCNNGLWGASVTCLLKTESSYFLGTNRGGIYVSSDKGENWIQKDNVLSYNTIYHLAQCGDNIFASTDSGCYKSSDNGLSWVITNPRNDSNYNYNYSFVTIDSTIFVSTYTGVYCSTNFGLNWEKKLSLSTTRGIIVPYAFKNEIYVGTYDALYCSKDLGENWSIVNIDTVKVWITSFTDINNKLIIAGNNGIYLQPDKSTKWVFKRTKFYTSELDFNVLTSKDGKIYGATDGGFFVSSDYGDSWIRQNDGLVGKGITSFLIDGENIYTGVQDKTGGFYKLSDDGNTWIKKNKGLTNTAISGFQTDDDKIIANISGIELYFSSDAGNTWIFRSKGLAVPSINATTYDNDNIFIGSDNGAVFHSTNNGEKWLQNDIGSTYFNITSMTQNNNQLLASTIYNYHANSYGELFYSSDFGNNWVTVNWGSKNLQVSNVASNNNNFYFCYYNSLFESKDNCDSWHDLYSDDLNGITALALNNNHIYIAYKYGNFIVSNDYGLTWTHKFVNNIKKTINTIKAIGNVVIVSFDDATYFFSNDNGDNWTEIDVSSIFAKSPRFAVNKNCIYICTNSNGLFRAKLSDFGIVDVKDEIPVADNSFTIQPNPANDQITIALKPSEGFERSEGFEILIYNALGEKVLTLRIDRDLSAQINISKLPKGVYFVRIGDEVAKFVKL